jgi:hypothetical protein
MKSKDEIIDLGVKYEQRSYWTNYFGRVAKTLGSITKSANMFIKQISINNFQVNSIPGI